jgi:hypothetical protein
MAEYECKVRADEYRVVVDAASAWEAAVEAFSLRVYSKAYYRVQVRLSGPRTLSGRHIRWRSPRPPPRASQGRTTTGIPHPPR